MILLYHHVAPERSPGAHGDSEGWRWRHTPEGFDRQLRELRRRGLRFVSLAHLVEEIQRTGREPPGTAVITFDDGWRDQHEYAVPVLQELGLTATFFVTTGHLGRPTGDPYRMSGAHLRELAEAGMTLGGHSRTHPDLTRVSESRAREEIAGCREDLESAIGQPVKAFAFPGGEFSPRVVDLTREAGYESACSVLGPAANDRSSLHWLYRDVLTERMDTLGDRYRMSPWARRLLAWRVRRRLRKHLAG